MSRSTIPRGAGHGPAERPRQAPAALTDQGGEPYPSRSAGGAGSASRHGVLRLPSWLDVPVFAVVAVAAAALQWHLTRGSVVYSDEYAWAFRFHHLGSGVLTLWGGWFDPLARFVYNALFATAGLADYRPYRALAVAANLSLAVAVHLYARAAGRRWLGVAAAALLMVLGSSAVVVLQPLNSMNAIGVAALPASLLLLARGRRGTDRWALAVLIVAMGFAGPVVLPVCLGVAVWLWLDEPRRPGRLVVPLAPLVLYVVANATLPGPESLGGSILGNVRLAPTFVADLAAAGAAGVLGLGMEKGPAVLGALVVAALVGVPRLPTPARRRVLAVVVTLVAVWGILAVGRAQLGEAAAPRYVVLTVVPMLLVALELIGNGATATRGVVVAAVLAFALVANASRLVDAGAALTALGDIQRSELGALELGLSRAPRTYRPDARPGSPLLYVTAGNWRAARPRLGSPAFKPADLPGASAEGRMQADRVLRELRAVEVHDGPAGGGRGRSQGGCAAGTGSREAPVPEAGVEVAAVGDRPVQLRVRRFGDAFPAEPLLVLNPGEVRLLRPVADASDVRWAAELRGGPASFCPGARPIG